MDPEEVLVRKRRPILAFGLCGIASVAIAYTIQFRKNAADSALNYQLVYDLPRGWSERPLTPGMIFVYENEKSHLKMRGAINNVVSEINPTPELTAEALIKQYASITEDRLSGWHYRLMESVKAHGAKFLLIRRWTSDRTVISAVTVRGNTTVIIALVGERKAAPKVDAGLSEFRNYLANLALVRYTYPEEPAIPSR